MWDEGQQLRSEAERQSQGWALTGRFRATEPGKLPFI